MEILGIIVCEIEEKGRMIIDQLLAGCDDPKEILGKKSLLRQLQKKLVELAR